MLDRDSDLINVYDELWQLTMLTAAKRLYLTRKTLSLLVMHKTCCFQNILIPPSNLADP